jgi:AhpD family alkylhydroperoxidase
MLAHCHISSSHFLAAFRHGSDEQDPVYVTRRLKMIQARMKNPVMILPDAMQAVQALAKSAEKGGVPQGTLDLVHLRASQINGCSVCVDMSHRFKKSGETSERLFMVAAWRETPLFTDAERAALALTEAVTRLSDRPDPVPDEIWNEAARHYKEAQLAALLLWIAMTNVWNRLNVATRQIAGEWLKSAEAQKWVEKQAAAR